MSEDLEKISGFLEQHHVLSLATSDGEELSVCSLFYVYSPKDLKFVVASSLDTIHISHILKHNAIAGNILLETQSVGKIQGVQFRGVFKKLSKEDGDLKKALF